MKLLICRPLGAASYPAGSDYFRKCGSVTWIAVRGADSWDSEYLKHASDPQSEEQKLSSRREIDLHHISLQPFAFPKLSGLRLLDIRIRRNVFSEEATISTWPRKVHWGHKLLRQ